MTVEEIKDLIQALDASAITTLKYNEGDAKLYLSKKEAQSEVIAMPVQAASQAIVPQAAPQVVAPSVQTTVNTTVAASDKEEHEGNLVVSPLVGTAYLAPSEDSDPFVKVGDTVTKGQTLAIVEAMKLMNEIESDYAGVVTEILVANEETVEYGQPLFVIK